MSLKRAIKAQGLKNVLKTGMAIATSKKISPAPLPDNESLRLTRVAESGLIGQDFSAQFEIYTEMMKIIMGCDQSMLNLIDDVCQFTIGATGVDYDPLLGVPRKMTFCQYTLLSSEPMIIEDVSKDDRFAESFLTKPPINCNFYAGFPLITADGVAIGTLCAIDSRSLCPSSEQVRLMRQLSVNAAGQIQLMADQAGLTASRVGLMLGGFRSFAPDGTLDELIGFLDFCARGTAMPETLSLLERDGIVTREGSGWRLTRDGADLKTALGLSPETYRGSSQISPLQGSGFDDLLGQLE